MPSCSYLQIVIEISATDAVFARSWMCVLAHGTRLGLEGADRGNGNLTIGSKELS